MGAGCSCSCCCCCCTLPAPRYTQITISTINHLKLIKGYINEPLLPLEEALKNFDGKIDHLSDKIKEAIAKCHQPSEHHLTRDESAAIYMYTMKWGQKCLYDHLQTAWNSEDRSQLEPWFKYLKLFKSALDKLPNIETKIWQGTAFDEKLEEKLNSKSSTLYSSMGSCLQSEDEIQNYLRNNVGTKTILIGYDCIDGKLMAGYTANNSKDVIVWPGTKLGVSERLVVDDNGSLIYHLKGKINHPPESKKLEIASSNKHFACPYKGCGNHCPGDHKADHCHGFANLFHTCTHHCGPCNKCDKCRKLLSNLCKCYNCGRCYCIKCCFK